jgi:hypothetical protein
VAIACAEAYKRDEPAKVKKQESYNAAHRRVLDKESAAPVGGGSL